MMEDHCMLRVLAQSTCCRIEYCDHELVHIHVGPISLRLGAEQAREVAITLGRAMRTVDQIDMENRRRALALVRPEKTEIC